MADESDRFRWISKAAYAAMLATLVFLAVLLAGAVALGVNNLLEDWSWQGLVRLGLTVLAILLLSLWAVAAYGVVRLVHFNEDSVHRTAGRLGRIEAVLQDQTESFAELTRLASLSDQTRNLAFRDRQVDALRDTFHDLLVRQEHEQAEGLIGGVAATLALAGEADAMRQELDESRKATETEKIDTAVRRIDHIIELRDWNRAERATRRMLQMFPDNETVAKLPERLASARANHKRELLQSYGEAVRKKDVDRGIELLRQLDQYLTPQEAAALEESARGVFRAKLHNLGVQFALRVTEEQWAQAVAVGEQIMREYPNTRMAHEVQEKMDRLRALADAVQQGQPPQA